MRKIQIYHYPLTVPEKFFLEKTVELLDPQTIDSYRLRMHNPLTILIELTNVIIDLNHNKLKNKSYATELIKEAESLLKTENELIFKSISKEFYMKLLSCKNGGKPDLTQILYATKLIIKDNGDYITLIFNKINDELSKLNLIAELSVSDFKILNGIVGYFYIELIKKGFSKAYLNHFFRSIFFSPAHGVFSNRMNILKTLITRDKEKFEVIVGLSVLPEYSDKIEILNSDFKRVSKREQTLIVRRTNENIQKFFHNYRSKALFYVVEVYAYDYYSSIKLARNKLQTLLDIIHMGHSDIKIDVISECAEIGEVQPSKAGVEKIKFYLDGYYKSEQFLYSEFLTKVKKIKEKAINNGTQLKITSSLRYLRLGFDSTELETKLLNYWIGLEYLFSSNDNNYDTETRIRNYFKKCHAVVYFKRNLKYLHDSISVNRLNHVISSYNDDLSYLLDVDNYNIIISKIKISPLLAYRTNTFKEHFLSAKVTKATIEKHQKNLDWNIHRIYRLRNEIVHNASIQPNIENVTSHLRYYLVFILNGLIDFLINEPVDFDGNGELTIDDYLIMQEILIENIYSDEKYQKFEYLLSMHNPIEYLS